MIRLLDQPDRLDQFLAERGLPGYRAGQVWRWIFQRRAADFHAMTDLPATLREELAERFTIIGSRVIEHQRDPDGTEKLLLQLAGHPRRAGADHPRRAGADHPRRAGADHPRRMAADAERIECVLLRDEKSHRTACISTQIGCAMGCTFCATGLDGLRRNLTRGEIVEQLLHLTRCLDEPERLTHIVVMGMGEPLANLDALLPALAVASDAKGLGIGVRRITISTVGLPSGIARLAELDSPYHLAVSLHAPDDGLRAELIPAARRTPLAELIRATDEYFAATGRRVTFEYVLLGGVNDSPEHAGELVRLLAGRPVLVNLIPFNPVPGLPYSSPGRSAVRRFAEHLTRRGLNAQVRHRRGETIDAACGQLRRRGTSSPPRG